MKGQTWVKLVSAEIRGEMVKVDWGDRARWGGVVSTANDVGSLGSVCIL